MPYTFTHCQPGDNHAAVAFALAAWRELFAPRLGTAALPADLQTFERTYCSPTGCFLLAHTRSGSVAGAIGYRAYDGRFAALGVPQAGTVEVVRLYVLPQHRRSGLGSQLVGQLLQIAEARGVARQYLHTHPFLPGAEQFWQRQGFEVVLREAEPVWGTIHMLR